MASCNLYKKMNEDKDFKWVIAIMMLAAFTVGFIVAEAIYNQRPITEEEYRESQRPQWYE